MKNCLRDGWEIISSKDLKNCTRGSSQIILCKDLKSGMPGSSEMISSKGLKNWMPGSSEIISSNDFKNSMILQRSEKLLETLMKLKVLGKEVQKFFLKIQKIAYQVAQKWFPVSIWNVAN